MATRLEDILDVSSTQASPTVLDLKAIGSSAKTNKKKEAEAIKYAKELAKSYPSKTKKELAASQPLNVSAPRSLEMDMAIDKAMAPEPELPDLSSAYVPSKKVSDTLKNFLPSQEEANAMNVESQSPDSVNVQKPVTGVWDKIPVPNLVAGPRVAAGSGLTNDQSVTNKLEEQNTLKDIEELKNEQRNQRKQDLSQSSMENIYEDPESIINRYNQIRLSPILDPQRKGIEDMQQQANLLLQMPSDYYTAPAAGFLKAVYGTDVSGLLAGKGQDPYAQMAANLGYKAKIQDDIKDLLSTTRDIANAKKVGTFGTKEGESLLTALLASNLARKEQEQKQTAGATVENKAQQTDPNRFISEGSGATKDPTDKLLKEHSDRMSKIDPLLTSFKELQSALGSAIPGGIENWSGKAIPGVGAQKFKVLTPLQKENAKAIKAAAEDLIIKLRKGDFGSALSRHEAESSATALGNALLGTTSEFVNAYYRTANKLKNAIKVSEAALAKHPDVLKLYGQNGATTSLNYQFDKPNKYLTGVKEKEQKVDYGQTKKPSVSFEEFQKQLNQGAKK